MRVGLLGGSFDPGHSGHVFISLQAIKRFNLQQVWWVITKQNPLKDNALYSTNYRLKFTKNQVKEFKKIKIHLSKYNTTFDDIQFFKNKFPQHQFIWIMGLDCLLNFHQWYRPEDIIRQITILIFNRNNLLHKSKRSKASLCFFENQISINNFSFKPGKLHIITTKEYNVSSTQIKKI